LQEEPTNIPGFYRSSNPSSPEGSAEEEKWELAQSVQVKQRIAAKEQAAAEEEALCDECGLPHFLFSYETMQASPGLLQK
jgi:hypothetical protein